MDQTGTSTTFGELIGTDGPSVRWGSVLSFCIALLVSGLFSATLASAVRGGSHLGSILVYGWAYLLGYPLLLTVSVVAVFRLFRRDFPSAFVAPVVYVGLTFAADLLLRHLQENNQSPASVRAWTSWMRFFGNLCFLYGMVLSLRWIKWWWLALPLGAAAAEVVMLAVGPLGTWLLGPPDFTPQMAFQMRLYQLPFTLAELAAFAGMLWVGREIAAAAPGRISKRFYLAATFGGTWLGLLLVIVIISIARSKDRVAPAIISMLVVAVVLAMLLAGVTMMVLVYKMWSSIQDGHARTTPGKALGFLFIPLFNFYWAFQAFWGFAVDYNRYIDRHKIQARGLPAGLFLVYVILCLVASIPILGVVVTAVNLFLGASMVAKVCDAVNHISAPRPQEIATAAS